MEAYYKAGTVFSRSPEYYTQTLSTMRRRSPSRHEYKTQISIQPPSYKITDTDAEMNMSEAPEIDY